TVQSLGQFSGSVQLTAEALPAGASSAPQTVTVGPGSRVSAALTIQTDGGAAAGTHSFSIRARSGNLAHTAGATLKVWSYSIVVTPTSQTVTHDGSTTAVYTVTVWSLENYRGSVALSVAGPPPGHAPVFMPPAVELSGTRASAGLLINPSATPPGRYTFRVQGTSGPAAISSPAVGLEVLSAGTQPSFGMLVQPLVATAIPGTPFGTARFTVRLQSIDRFFGPVELSARLPAGVSSQVTFEPQRVEVPPNGTVVTSTLAVTPAARTRTFTVDISARAGTIVRSTRVTVNTGLTAE
ncbi:MAG TPA: hypothetical protein VNP72_09810, partial [Longimicrobium sp.]|nr:hypothetical protein [Longimicrobium sp.]